MNNGMRHLSYIPIIACALTLTACGDNGDQPDAAPKALTFTTSVDSPSATRAGKTGFSAGDKIGVMAYHLTGAQTIADVAPNFMYGQEVEFDGSAWTYSPLKYWPNNSGDRLSFYGYYPMSAVTTSAATQKGLPVLTYSNPALNVDLLAARNESIQRGSTVALPFRHILAEVNFSFTYNGNSANKYDPVIHTIIFNAPYKGTFDYTYNDTDGKLAKWTVDNEATTTVQRFTAAEGVVVTQAKHPIPEFTCYLLPCTVSEFSVSIDNVLHPVSTDVTFEAGKSYNIDFTISRDNDGPYFITSYSLWESGGEINGKLQ